MNDLEKIQRYIERTKIKNEKKYTMYLSDMMAFKQLSEESFYTMVCLVFEYGQAKGYRAAKKEIRA